MRTFSLDTYRTQWPRVGGVLAIGLGGALAVAGRRMPKTQVLSVANFIALLAHQYEEYEDPGWFPGQFNHGVLGSDQPRNYPLNTHIGMLVNTVFGYPFYILPILFPRNRWLGLAPVLFGIGQAVGHGVVLPRRAGDSYSPGFLTALLLHTPIGIAYIRALKARDGAIRRSDWPKAVACAAVMGGLGLAAPITLLRDRDSPHAFTRAQMGHHDTTDQ